MYQKSKADQWGVAVQVAHVLPRIVLEKQLLAQGTKAHGHTCHFVTAVLSPTPHTRLHS